MEFPTYMRLDLSSLCSGSACTSAELRDPAWQTNTHQTHVSRRPWFHLPRANRDQTSPSGSQEISRHVFQDTHDTCFNTHISRHTSQDTHRNTHSSRHTFQDMQTRFKIHMSDTHILRLTIQGSCFKTYASRHIVQGMCFKMHAFQDMHFKTKHTL